MAKGSKGIDVLSSIEKGYLPNDSRQKKIKKRRGGNVEKGPPLDPFRSQTP